MKWGRILGITVVASAAVSLGIVVWKSNRYPRTDDATVRANLIEIAPEVQGRLVQLPVRDNEYVKKGDLLYEIDPRSYEYALEIAESDQAELEQQIADQLRRIAAETSASEVAKAEAQRSDTSVKTAGSVVSVSAASVARAEATVEAATSRLELAKDDLARVAPLLLKEYVTVQEVDATDTALRVAQGSYDEALAALDQAKQEKRASLLRKEESSAASTAAQARLRQALHDVNTTTLRTLESERPGRAARVEEARVNLERTRVVAPFDAYVTNMNVSVGAYAHVGTAVFTLIDTRVWYVLANYREGKLPHIPIGAKVDVYLLSHPDRRFDGVVESIGFGVFPADGEVASGLPDITRTLNWVHLSARFPVRIRVLNPDPVLMRIGETAVSTVR